ncbi:hypothetical protein BVRB_5g102950 [Beta vulgaris subsp. vulgaris]|uniref:early light-induced protein 2, chloroplastic n=1 Tax=Beta vulgaris subsp. vulgaris TaxID=3555 RepID=UPI00053F9D18|nr:early light-induced protein 2, chloroplastic [Beta vulgaris subsp. vulgaris]KMT12360.1 hypothetical protein BVRB_5g102950 [Beta vulgaris subsp. vulgaris]
MSMSMQMQSGLLVNPVGALSNGSRMTYMVSPLGFNPRMTKRVNFEVKCMAGDEPKPKPQPKVSTSFGDLFAFSGPAPERINGRLAMIGFVAAVAVELSKGTDLFSQISNGGAEYFIGTSILLSVASLVPLFQGQRAEAKTDGLMNANAELWNGRIAMLGLVALAFTEFVKGGALV